jgi:hypothetical protein
MDWVQQVNGRADLRGRLALGKHRRGPIVAKTAHYTVTAADSGTVFTNTGAEAQVNFTLPAVSEGLCYEFIATANFPILVKTATADTLITFNDVEADSISIGTENEIIGGVLVAICDGTNFIGYSPSILHTLTVAT